MQDVCVVSCKFCIGGKILCSVRRSPPDPRLNCVPKHADSRVRGVAGNVMCIMLPLFVYVWAYCFAKLY